MNGKSSYVNKHYIFKKKKEKIISEKKDSIDDNYNYDYNIYHSMIFHINILIDVKGLLFGLSHRNGGIVIEWRCVAWCLELTEIYTIQLLQ